MAPHTSKRELSTSSTKPTNSQIIEVFTRDWATMMVLTIVLLVFGLGRGGKGRINRVEGAVLLILYIAYMVWLFISQTGATA